jgi:hypothetical protein
MSTHKFFVGNSHGKIVIKEQFIKELDEDGDFLLMFDVTFSGYISNKRASYLLILERTWKCSRIFPVRLCGTLVTSWCGSRPPARLVDRTWCDRCKEQGASAIASSPLCDVSNDTATRERLKVVLLHGREDSRGRQHFQSHSLYLFYSQFVCLFLSFF